ncbi:MAG: glycosyltransferase family 4 protein, partial [Planctomycetota bacterium]
MHILFLSHYFPPECNAPASRTYEHCREWVRAGHDVTVVTSVPNCPSGVVYDGYRNRLLQREQVDGMNVYRIWTYIAANKGQIKRTANYATYMLSACLFSMLPKKPDVLVATSPQFLCGWAGVMSSKLRRTPFILEIRDIWPESIAAVGGIRNRGILKILTWMERKMYKSADHIVTVGDGYKSRLLERNVPTEKISVVMNGIDPNLFHPRAPNETLKRQLGLEGASLYRGTGCDA